MSEAILEAYGSESKHTALAALRWAQLLTRTANYERALELASQSVAVFDTDAKRGRHAKDLNEAKALLTTIRQRR